MSRAFGPADNARFYRTWLRTDALFDTLFLSSLDLPPFSETFDDITLPTMSYLAWYGRHLVVNPARPVSRSNVLVAMWADMMGPYISTDKIATQQASRAILIESVSALLQDNIIGIIGDASVETYIAEGDQQTAAEWNGLKTRGENQLTPDVAIRVLRHLTRRAGPAFSIGGVNMIVHVYLAILKRGTMSEAFVEKITSGLNVDLQVANLRIDLEACRTFYAIFGDMVTDETIPRVTEHWSQLLPVSALRLRLTVMQAAGSGLTALSVTGRAIKTFVDFDWARIIELYPDEWANFEAAVRAVGTNVWFGFRKELGLVSSTKYKNISYVAKELLIKVNGETSLRTYGGWTRRAKFQGVVDTLVASYEQAKTANIVERTAMPEVTITERVTGMRDLISAGGDVYA